MLHRLASSWIALLALALLAGCDDVVLFDVAPDGSLLVAADAEGLCALVADGAKPRHLFRVDPVSQRVTRLTRTPQPLSWPRACGRGAVLVEGRRRLVLLDPEGRSRTLFDAARNLYQPVPHPSGDAVLVLEAARLGVPAKLHVVSVAESRPLRSLDGCLLGATWTPDGGLLVARSREAREPFASGPGSIDLVRADSERTLFRGAVPAVPLMQVAEHKQVLAVLHLDGEQGPLGLALLSAEQRGTRRGARGVFDFWPAVSPDRRRALFTRSNPDDPQLYGELRLASLESLESSRVVPTPTTVAAPRWVGADQVAFVTADSHLILQDLAGQSRVDLTPRLRAAFAPEESK